MRINEFINDACPVCGQTPCNCTGIKEEKVRLDPKCWSGKKIGNPKTKVKGGVRVNNCVPAESVAEGSLEEIDRRGFLKGAGAAALAGAGLSATGNAKADEQEINKWVNYATNLAIESMGWVQRDAKYALREWLVENVSKWVADYCRYTNSYNAKGVIDYCNQQGAEASGMDKRNAAEIIFQISMKERYQNFLNAYKDGMKESYLRFKQVDPNLEQKRRENMERIRGLAGATGPTNENQQGVAEGFNGEYDDEAGMAHTNLVTIARAAQGLLDTIDSHENLPEWVQEKIARVEGMIVKAWDYLKSQEAQGIDPRIGEMFQGINESWQDMRHTMELNSEFNLIENFVHGLAARYGVSTDYVWEDLETLSDDELYVFAATSEPIMEDWQKANKRDKTDGMSQKAVNAYRREHPGSKLKTAVTTKPSKLKKGSKASKRRKSYCSRSRGQMKMHNISCAKTPDKAICKARRRWNC